MTVGVMGGAVAVVVLWIYSSFGAENHYDDDDKNDDEWYLQVWNEYNKVPFEQI